MRDFLVRNELLDNPKLAEELGHLNVAWAALDLRLFKIFEVLTALPTPIARAIYYSQNTTRSRIDLVKAVAPIVLRRKPPGPQRRHPPLSRMELGPNSAQLKAVSRLLGQIGKLAGERNKFDHDPWVGHETSNRAYQLRLRGKEIHGEFEPVRLRDIVNVARKIETKTAALHRLHEILEPKVFSLHSILEFQHDLFLVPAKKATPQKKRKAKQRRSP